MPLAHVFSLIWQQNNKTQNFHDEFCNTANLLIPHQLLWHEERRLQTLLTTEDLLSWLDYGVHSSARSCRPDGNAGTIQQGSVPLCQDRFILVFASVDLRFRRPYGIVWKVDVHLACGGLLQLSKPFVPVTTR